MKNGFSLVEILLAISIFSILGILSFQSIFVSLRSSNKSRSIVEVRENIDYSLASLERNLRNASTVECLDSLSVSYQDSEGNTGMYSCILGDTSYMASSSARLTNSKVKIDECTITCDQGDASVPPSVTIDVTASSSEAQNEQSSSVNISTKVNLRTY